MNEFPVVTGVNLLREKVMLPEGLEGEKNVLLIAFQQWQQGLIDTWLPFLEEAERMTIGLRYYELPTIQKLGVLSRTFINEGMRAGIRDAATRARTITLYLDKEEFRSALGLPDESTIYLLLVDRQGRILWRAQGEFTPEKGESLIAALRSSGGREQGEKDEQG